MSESSNSVVGTNELPPRRERRPRVLSYNKCRFCRDPKVKSKCIWNQGSWPNRCKRCLEKDLPCSRPLHKAEERRGKAQSGHTLSHTPQDVEGQIANEFEDAPSLTLEIAASNPSAVEGLSDHLALHLLSLHSVVLMALEELTAICKRHLKPLLAEELASDDPAPEEYTTLLYKRYSAYEDFASDLKKHINRLASHNNLAVSAALDLNGLAYAPGHFFPSGHNRWENCDQDLDSTIDEYYEAGHFGMATVFLTKRFLIYGVVAARVPLFTECRRAFGSHIASLIASDDLSNIAPDDVRQLFDGSQLFVPRDLLQHPLIRQDYKKLGLRDCLGRSVALREYDAGLDVVTTSLTEDPQDYIGRTLLHAACLRGDEHMVGEILGEGLDCGTKTDAMIPPLHIAAVQGDLPIFRKLLEHYYRTDNITSMLSRYPRMENISLKLLETDHLGRTCLEWAVSREHSPIFQYLLDDELTRWYRDGYLQSEKANMLFKKIVMTTFKAALRFGRTHILEILVSSLDIVSLNDDLGRTPLWYAAHYKRLHAMRLLDRLPEMHIPDKEQRTPLHEAARVGFTGGVNYELHSWLTQRAPSPWHRDIHGKTAEDLARENGHIECAGLLF